MGFVTDLPDANIVSLSQLKTYLDSNTPVPSGRELVDKGYLPLIHAGVVSVNTSGQLVWGTDSSGQKKTVDKNSDSTNTNTLMDRYANQAALASVSSMTSSGSALAQLKRRIVNVPITLDGAGAASDEVIWAALASYFGVAEFVGIISDTTDASVDFHFEESSGPTDVLQLPGGNVNLGFTANVLNTDLKGLRIWGANDNSALRVDISNGVAGAVIILQFVAWYET